MATQFTSGRFSSRDGTGAPLVGGLLYTYNAGTTNAKTTWSNSALTVANTNPVVLDSRGEAIVWWGTGSIRMQLRDALGVVIWDEDNIPAISADADVLRTDLASSTDAAKGDALIGVNREETAAVGRTLSFWIKANRRNLCDYLTTAQTDDVLSGTGAIDISTPFAAALSAASGGVLELPAGRIRADNLTIGGTRSVVCGQGFATRISAPTAANNVFTVSGDFAEIRDLMIDSLVARTGGRYVDILAAANRFRLQGFLFDGFHEGIRTAAAATVTVADGMMLNGVAATGVGIRISDGFDVSVRDVIMDAALDLLYGIVVTKAGDVTLEDLNIVHGGQALLLNPGETQQIASLWANNSFFDTSVRGMEAHAAGGSIVRCIFDQCWFSGHTSFGANLATSAGGSIDGMYFNGCQFFLNGNNGLNVGDTGVINVHVRGGSSAQNTGNSGYNFAEGVSKFSVIGARAGAGDGLTGNAIGINVVVGASAEYTLTDNILRGNTTAPLVDGGTGTGRVVHTNPDYDVGRVVYDPPSLADGAGVTTTVSVFGARLGDMAEASFSNDLLGITVTAWVSSNGIVSVRFQNETGGALDLPSGTLVARTSRFT